MRARALIAQMTKTTQKLVSLRAAYAHTAFSHTAEICKRNERRTRSLGAALASDCYCCSDIAHSSGGRPVWALTAGVGADRRVAAVPSGVIDEGLLVIARWGDA